MVDLRAFLLGTLCCCGCATRRGPRPQMISPDRHTEAVRALAFSPDGRLLASGSADGAAYLWDVKMGGLRHIIVGSGFMVQRLAFSPRGQKLLVKEAWLSGSADVWDLRKGCLLKRLGLPDFRWAWQAPEHARCAAFMPDGEHLAVGASGRVFLFHLDTWSVAKTLSPGARSRRYAWPACMAVSPNGSHLAVGYESGMLVVWDLRTATAEHATKAHARIVSAVAYSSDGETFVSASRDGKVKLWDPWFRRPKAEWEVEGGCSSLAISPDGRWLAVCNDSLVLHRLPDGKAIRKWERVHSAAFSPDSTKLAIGGRLGCFGAVTLADPNTGRVERTFGHANPRLKDAVEIVPPERVASGTAHVRTNGSVHQ